MKRSITIGFFLAYLLLGGAWMWMQEYQPVVATTTTTTTTTQPPGPDTNDTSLVAYYQLESNWVDTISGSNATAYGTPYFTNDCKHGSYAARFKGNSTKDNVATYNATLLNGKNGCSIGGWIKLIARNNWGGLYYAKNGAGTQLMGLNQWGSGEANIYGEIYSGTADAYTKLAFPLGAWVFTVMTWTNTPGVVLMYTNGLLAVTGTDVNTGAIAQSAAFLFGAQPFATDDRYSDCILDDPFVFNRPLSSNEVRTLYLSYP